MMMTLIGAAVAAAQPAAAPANAHAQHAQTQPGQMAPMAPQQHQAMKQGCCCKQMGNTHSGHGSDGTQNHREQGGR